MYRSLGNHDGFFLTWLCKEPPICTSQWLLIGDHSVHKEGYAVNGTLRSDIFLPLEIFRNIKFAHESVELILMIDFSVAWY